MPSANLACSKEGYEPFLEEGVADVLVASDPEQRNIQLQHNEAKRSRAWKIFAGLSIPEALNFASIFTMLHFCADFLFNTPMRFVVFPLAAICGLTKASRLWHVFRCADSDYRLAATEEEKKQKLEVRRIAFLQAFWETINGLGTTSAVIVGIVGFFTGAAVGMGISITFAVFLSLGSLICAAYAIYFGVTAYQAKTAWHEKRNAMIHQHMSQWTIEERETYRKASEKEKKQIRNQMLLEIFAQSPQLKRDYEAMKKDYDARISAMWVHLRWFGVVSLLAIGTGISFVGGFTLPGWIIGGVGCLLAASYAAYNLYQMYQHKKPDQVDANKTSTLSSSAVTVQALNPGEKADPNATMQNIEENGQADPNATMQNIEENCQGVVALFKSQAHERNGYILNGTFPSQSASETASLTRI